MSEQALRRETEWLLNMIEKAELNIKYAQGVEEKTYVNDFAEKHKYMFEN